MNFPAYRDDSSDEHSDIMDELLPPPSDVEDTWKINDEVSSDEDDSEAEGQGHGMTNGNGEGSSDDDEEDDEDSDGMETD